MPIDVYREGTHKQIELVGGGGVKCEKYHSLMSNLAISHLPARFSGKQASSIFHSLQSNSAKPGMALDSLYARGIAIYPLSKDTNSLSFHQFG